MTITSNRLGQNNLTGDVEALFETEFEAKVIKAFEQHNIMDKYHNSQTVHGITGKDFPLMGQAKAKYYTAVDTQVDTNNVRRGQITVTLDDFLYSAIAVYDKDRITNNWTSFTDLQIQECGKALAREYELNIMRMALITARSAAPMTELEGGSVIENANLLTSGDALADSIYEAGTVLDEKNVPHDAVCIMRPRQYDMLAKNGNITDMNIGGDGSYSEGRIGKINDIPIIKSNFLPKTDISADTDVYAKYRGDFSKTVGLIIHKDAVATLKAGDLFMEKKREADFMRDLYITKMLVGHGSYNPACAIELRLPA